MPMSIIAKYSSGDRGELMKNRAVRPAMPRCWSESPSSSWNSVDLSFWSVMPVITWEIAAVPPSSLIETHYLDGEQPPGPGLRNTRSPA